MERGASPSDRAGPARRGPGRSRRGLRFAAIALFATQMALFDLSRGALVDWKADPRRLVGLVASVSLGLLVATTATRRWTRVALAIVYATLLVVDLVFVRYYHEPLDAQIVLTAIHAWRDVRPIAMHLLPRLLPVIVVVTIVELALLAQAPHLSWPRRTAPCAAALLALAILLGPPLRRATPELRLLDAARAPFATRALAATSKKNIPPLPSTRGRPPSVLFVLSESVRASDYCAGKSAGCPYTPALDARLPDRIALPHLYAVSSYTAVSLSAILTGRTQLGPRASLLAAPSLFDLVKATRVRSAGRETPRVVYASSQSREVFEERDVRAAVDDFSSVEDLIGGEALDEEQLVSRGLDRQLCERLEAAMQKIGAPSFIVAHLSGTHAPYYVDEAQAPFSPFEHDVTWSGLELLHAAYRDAVVAQDAVVARLVASFVDAQHGEPWVVVFTSDHGEAFGEHGAIHHGQSLYDEQIHVPGWIAFGNGALDEREERTLRARADDTLTHLDLLPTLLDLYGVADDFALAETVRTLPGTSWLREPPRDPRPTPISNCTEMFPCPLDTWGMLGTHHELVAQRWDGSFRCIPLDGGNERPIFSVPECGTLLDASRDFFPTQPNGRANR